MKKQVILPIIERHSNYFSNFMIKIFILGVIGIFLNIFLLNSMFLYWFIIGLIVMSIITMRTINVDKRVGVLVLTEFIINIDNKEIIPIQDVMNLKITISGFEGRKGIDNFRSFYADDGKNNFIEFIYNNSHKKFRVLVSSQNYETLINIVDSIGRVSH